MISTSFLNSLEAKLIANDWEQLLRSAESCEVTIKTYSRSGATTDSVFNVQTGGTLVETSHQNQRAIQEIVSPYKRDLTSWAELTAGNSIFYFSTLNEHIPGNEVHLLSTEFRIITPSGSRWVSVPNPARGLEDFLRLRLGPVSRHIGKIVVAAPESLAQNT